MLAMLYVLLGFSVIVSLFGMVNTMVLSVFERTREIGMLRTIGMTRRQARRMIRHESIITALIGATLGIGLGVFLAALVTQAVGGSETSLVIPYQTLAGFTLVAVLAGIGAAILPARRASRLDVLDGAALRVAMTATITAPRAAAAPPSGRSRARLARLERPLLLAGLALVALHLLDLAFSGPDTSMLGVLGIVAVPAVWALAQPHVTRPRGSCSASSSAC